LEAEFEAVEYTDSLLEEALKQIQKQFATQEEVESVAEGDLVKIAATRSRPEGAADMEPLQIEREITVGENQYGKELNENLLGKQVGAIISGRLFDESEEEEEVKLREAEFEIEIKEIKRTLLPEINDEFAKDAGFENVQELKETIAKDKKLEIEKHNRNLKVQAMEKALHDANPVEFPATVVKDYALNLAEDWAKQYNLEPEKLLPMFMPIAEFQMRVYFLKHQLIEELEIKAEEADKENLIREAAEHLNIEVEEYKKLYAKQIASPEFESKVKEEKIDNLIMEKISFIKPQPQSAEQAEEEE
jgi:trigger factor